MNIKYIGTLLLLFSSIFAFAFMEAGPVSASSHSDIGKVFGQILPPQAIQYLGFGSTGISKFLSNLVALFYSVAIIVLIFMLLWGAFDWITSEGDKEKLESARNKLISAVIGIMLFAVAFAIIQILGTFTGFKFFEGQK